MINIIPKPQYVKENKGYFKVELPIRTFNFDNLVYESKLISVLSKKVDATNLLKKEDILLNSEEKKASLIFICNESLKKEEYILEITQEKVCISYSSKYGKQYALESLLQLLSQDCSQIKCCLIKDEPLYGYRGFMLDVGRYYYKLDEVKQFVDLMCAHKLNVFHFHLTEDQGWRIEIKKYPLLTERGSKRSHTNFGIMPHKGFYTQQEIKEIVSYCHDRNIMVIPEIDMPGHMVSAIACYPELSCFDRNLKVSTHWGIKHDILCAGKESTYRFIFDVLDEILPLFPDKIIHIGGDEAVKTRWNLCPKCQEVIEKNNLKDVENLQQHFMSTIDNYLLKKGFNSMMWNWDVTLGTEHLNKSILWNLCGMNSESYDKNMKEIENGRKVVNTSAYPYYLDLPFGTNTLKSCYNFVPEFKELSANATGNMLGIEAPLWTEYVPNMKKAMLLTLPRLTAICEIAWSKIEDRNYQDFYQRLPIYLEYLSLLGFKGFAKSNMYNPTKTRAKLSRGWFNRRVLHWQGLHNLIDNAKVKKLAEKKYPLNKV